MRTGRAGRKELDVCCGPCAAWGAKAPEQRSVGLSQEGRQASVGSYRLSTTHVWVGMFFLVAPRRFSLDTPAARVRL
jgi:hypothetical protein